MPIFVFRFLAAHINMYYKVLFLLFFIHFHSFSQRIPADSIQADIKASLQYLSAKQCTQTIEGKQYAGEWEAHMRMEGFILLLGHKSNYRDSNCFTMAGIHNILAEMYLADTSQKMILPMLQKVFPEVLSYSTGIRFNFWKQLPPNRDLLLGAEPNPAPLVRRPTTFKLEKRFINKAANVENDADDTSMGNLAIWYHKKIFGVDSLKTVKPNLFDSYLDKDRKNRHWYNYLYHGFKKSGAYLTWLGDEEEFDNWNITKAVWHNLVFYLPYSVCFPHAYQPYIPWGTNDVDVVVNANVLTYLAKSGLTQKSKGSEAAHQLIEKHAKRGRWARMGIYYPNRFHFHYAVSRAFAAGDTALAKTGQYLLDNLTKTQQADGSYKSDKKVNNHDRIQSTVYAALSLLYLKEAGMNVPSTLIDKSMAYLRSQRNSENQETYWQGGVFFSGGTVVRKTLFFTSDAYTTALVALAFQKYRQLM
ncbi:prenyltransferase/squalene oxidase repeat-containing protein [Emticicia fontis]